LTCEPPGLSRRRHRVTRCWLCARWPKPISPSSAWLRPPKPPALAPPTVEIGIDYAIGNPAWTGGGVGTLLVAALVAEARRPHLRAGILTAAYAANTASQRVLEKNGFHLVAVRPVATEPSDAPMAIYRLPAVAAHL
jgi:RimJ/RimL family protein N-acetyltransferase